MKNMDKEPTVPKWVLINWPKIPQMPQKISAQFVCPSPKVVGFSKQKLCLGVRSPWFQPLYKVELYGGHRDKVLS